MEPRRDVGVVLSGGGVNGVLMELGFLQRLRESLLWPRVGAIFGASAGALTGLLAALDRLDELGLTLAQLALAWVLHEPNVASAIIGASRPEQIEDNVGAVGVELSDDVLRRIDEILGDSISYEGAAS